MEDPFAGSRSSRDCTMSINGLTCTLNMPLALTQRFGTDGQEMTQSLPPYAPRKAFAVDAYPACPTSWMKGSATEASYFVPVRSEHGLWLDFNGNASNPHHVAALISIQGVNAITGQRTDQMRLEQYRTNCPVHNVPFGHERFCPICGYKWDAQNYLAGNATPLGLFWLDGFRAEDGITRQFVLTEERMRGIAAQLIGEERVFAIGIAFFLSKEPKPQIPRDTGRRPGLAFDDIDPWGKDIIYRGGVLRRMLATTSPTLSASAADQVSEAEIRQTALEIAAGAKINQRVHPDPLDLEKWQEKPAGIIYINYVDEETAKRIIAAGKVDMTAGGEGFLSSLLVGN